MKDTVEVLARPWLAALTGKRDGTVTLRKIDDDAHFMLNFSGSDGHLWQMPVEDMCNGNRRKGCFYRQPEPSAGYEIAAQHGSHWG